MVCSSHDQPLNAKKTMGDDEPPHNPTCYHPLAPASIRVFEPEDLPERMWQLELRERIFAGTRSVLS